MGPLPHGRGSFMKMHEVTRNPEEHYPFRVSDLAPPHASLAIETSTGHGCLALGIDHALVETRDLPEKRRHNVDLADAIDALLRDHQLGPRDLREVYVSLGPGSFTGLRVALATVQMLALSLDIRVLGVPTLDVLIAQHPGHAVALAIKHGHAWSASPSHAPAMRPVDEVMRWPEPLIADTLEGATPARPDAAVLWQLGRSRAARHDFDNPATLLPLYLREPEAVTLWEARKEKESPRRQEGQGTPS